MRATDMPPPAAVLPTSAPASEGVNNEENLLLHSMKQMSLAAGSSTPLTPTSPSSSHDVSNDSISRASTASPARSSIAALRRAPSTGSLTTNERPSPPALHKKASMSSLKSAGGVTPPRSPALRRSASYFHNLSMGDRSSLPPPVVEETPRIPLTAASVARQYFEKELQVKHAPSELAKHAETVVILQDACYGHRYSRPRTSKSNLSTIVERPERIHASLLGVASAYVRLGGRHAGGVAPPHPDRDATSLPAVPFRIHKTSRTLSLKSPTVAAVHGASWMEELVTMCEQAESKLAMGGKELTRTTSGQQTGTAEAPEKPTLHEGDLYLCSESLNALEGALGGVCAGVDAIFSEKATKRAFVCIRPPGHHCSGNLPSGFCWLNNVHVGIGHAASTHGLTHAAIIDFDLHHGDGSQSIAWAHNARIAALPKNTPMSKKVQIGYFSLHDINSYPCEEGDEEKVRNASLCIENAHGQSIWNVHFQPWRTMSEFWALYEERYLVLLDKARAFLKAQSDRLKQAPTHPKPKGAIFLSAGFDASEWEGSGMQRHQVNVPTEFYARFTQDVISMAEEEALGVGGRVISVLEGGYSDRALMSGVLSHISGMVTAGYGSQKQEINSEASELTQGRPRSSHVFGESIKGSHRPARGIQSVYDPAWWSLPALEELEHLINPLAQSGPNKGTRTKLPPTFTSPTESFIAKVLPVPSSRRSISGSNGASVTSTPRSPTPPPPEVNWTTAAQELCNLLVPSDRETKSCKPEDLNAEATRKRRDRQSNIGLPSEVVSSEVRQLPARETRNKAAKPSAENEEPRRLPSRASRRKTVADVSLISEETKTAPSATAPQIKAPARRRSSVASSSGSLSALVTDRGSEPPLPPITDNYYQQEPLVVQKSRPPAGATNKAPRPAPVKKAASGTRAPSATSTADSSSIAQAHEATNKAPLATNSEAQNKDVDRLASSMKSMSIKLHVPPREEYEARQQKPKPAPRSRPVKPTTARTTKPKSPTKPKGKTFAQTAPQNDPSSEAKIPVSDKIVGAEPMEGVEHQTEPPTPKDHEAPRQAVDLEPSALPVQSPSDLEAAPQVAQTTQNVSEDHTRGFALPALPQEPVTSTTTASPTSPQAPPPPRTNSNNQTSTPVTSKRMTKQDLPVFTSTSPIPFGKPKPAFAPMDMTMNGKVPSSPPNSDSASAAPVSDPSQMIFNHQQIQTPHTTQSSSSSSGMLPPPPPQPQPRSEDKAPLNGGHGNGNSTSIWDVPATPQAPDRSM